MLATDPDIRYCHYLASFRDDEEESTTRVLKMVDDVELQGVQVNHISLGKFHYTAGPG